MSDYLLTFELGPEKNELDICTDTPGLEYLIDQLSRLLESTKKKKTEHIHLFTEEWGGYELSSQNQVGKLLNKVTIHCWNAD